MAAVVVSYFCHLKSLNETFFYSLCAYRRNFLQ